MPIPTAAAATDDRCVRNDGKSWRCSFPRSSGSRFCEKHHAYYQMTKSGAFSKPRVRVSDSSASKKRGRPQKMKRIDEIVDSRVSAASIEEEDDDDEEEVSRIVELGEIWAFSKESDGTPRSYARIDRVVPTPSLVKAKLLVPCLVTDEEKIFAKNGLPLSCGLFRVSEESSLTMEISEFTHKVSFEIEEEGSSLFKIFPKKGEIWAVYLSWDAVKKRYEYKLVEVESDFSEEEGLKVIGLVKVEGVDGVYQRQVFEGFYLVRSFSRGFMPMFSHQVAARRVVEGDEILWKLST